jgi:2-dehydro-3-deoxyphosphooctonate aldolase (KDO 8-P synthase)
MKTIKLNSLTINNQSPLVLIAGPCQIESLDHALFCAEHLSTLAQKLQIGFIYKTSFDKGNRTKLGGARGIGLEAATKVFEVIKQRLGCLITTDVHNETQVPEIAPYVDILQIPAFMCRQTDLLLAAGKTGKVVNVKKGQFLAPWDMQNVAEKIASTGNENIMLTERGVTFGYNRLINDMRAIPIMKETGYPVIFDATHSVQEPGGLGNASGGQREFVQTVATAAVAIGVAGLFVETHPDPESAPSDGPCMLPMHNLEGFVRRIMEFDRLAKKGD